jgi:hypothetical protein
MILHPGYMTEEKIITEQRHWPIAEDFSLHILEIIIKLGR